MLENVRKDAGIVIKVPESWKSRRLLEYGRKYFVDGVQVSGALKKVSRLTSEANQALRLKFVKALDEKPYFQDQCIPACSTSPSLKELITYS